MRHLIPALHDHSCLTWGEKSDLWIFVCWLVCEMCDKVSRREWLFFAFDSSNRRVEKTLLIFSGREKPRGGKQQMHGCWRPEMDAVNWQSVTHVGSWTASQIASQAFPFQPGSGSSHLWGDLSNWGVTRSLLSFCSLISFLSNQERWWGRCLKWLERQEWNYWSITRAVCGCQTRLGKAHKVI